MLTLFSETKIFEDFTIILFASMLSVVGLHVFIEPAEFAAVGVGGISVMMHKIFGINIGYVSMLINIPLLILAWFFLSRKYVVYTLIFNIMSSFFVLVYFFVLTNWAIVFIIPIRNGSLPLVSFAATPPYFSTATFGNILGS